MRRFRLFNPKESLHKLRKPAIQAGASPTHIQQSLNEHMSYIENDSKYIQANIEDPIDTYKYYSSLRIYKESSWYDLANIVVMTTACRNKIFVDNCNHVYSLSNKILGTCFLYIEVEFMRIVGKRLTEFAVENTMARIFTSGGSLQSMDKFIDTWRHPSTHITHPF